MQCDGCKYYKTQHDFLKMKIKEGMAIDSTKYCFLNFNGTFRFPVDDRTQCVKWASEDAKK